MFVFFLEKGDNLAVAMEMKRKWMEKVGRRPSYHPLTPCSCTYFTHARTCDNVRVQSATQWTASVHTLHMPKPVITFVFKVLRNGLLPYVLYTCPNL